MRDKTKAPLKLFSSGRAVPSLIAFLLMLLVLLVFNFSARRLLQLFLESKEADLASRLRGAARMVEYELSRPYPPFIVTSVADRPADQQASVLEFFEGTESHSNITRSLSDFQELTGLSRISLMTTHGLIIADSRRSAAPGEPNVFVELDKQQFEQAQRGRYDQVQLYYIGNDPFLRLYAPYHAEGRVVAILQLAASAEYVKQHEELARRVRFQVLISSLLLLAIGVSLYRIFQYLVRVEKSALQATRVEAMGALAAGVAHELRNPLSIIRMMSEEIAADNPAGSRSTQNAHDIIIETERLNELVSNFLSLSRPPDASELTRVDAADVVSRVVELMRKGAEQNVRFHLDVPSSPVFVQADERALRQVLLNLLINAREAVDAAGGDVRVSVRERRGQAEIRVVDTGAGIPPRDAARIFEPFFTTKKMGTGLGLPISRTIVENLGGSLTVQSTAGRGTEATVTLPVGRSGGIVPSIERT